jgi:hypothetical protein
MNEPNRATIAAFPHLPTAAETLALAARLRELEPNAILTYPDIKRILGEDPQSGRGYNRAMKARKILSREGKEFKPETGVGLRRLDAAGIAGTVANETHLIHGAVKRTLNKAANCDLNELAPEARSNLLARMSQLAVIGEFATDKAALKIEAKLGQSPQRLSLEKTIEAIGGGENQK